MTSYTDYLFLLSPPQNIRYEISRYKKASAKHIGNFKSMDSPAHISIWHVERQKPFFADGTVERMEAALKTLPPILMHIDGFKYFTHLHGRFTIYAHIRISPDVDEWLTSLKKILKIKKTLVSHITVVRDVPEADFNKLWLHFRHKKWVEPFWIKELHVLKRETFSNTPKWENFKIFPFKRIIDSQIANAPQNTDRLNPGCKQMNLL
ncbi:2'-5' RNA ligase family protein [Mucilaginibacter segetis]|uniref:2'-5' RNA ligase family protein n=1 Tax=Mucilaginibacter segetis TaxID=2793071 RepID=A0A934PUU9_9SPHI|nr:2'-5' RNA ligase family protein [Mucilaginibacter segetis]MBK0379438.1 2'-5' RNA ligase family protein [Mucilaginibacter segetis]